MPLTIHMLGPLLIRDRALAGCAGGLTQQRFGVIAAASRRVAVYHRGRRAAAPWSVVAGKNPELPQVLYFVLLCMLAIRRMPHKRDSGNHT